MAARGFLVIADATAVFVKPFARSEFTCRDCAMVN